MAGLYKVISGGQTGVDQAALNAALHCGLAVGGWCPPGCLCESGNIPEWFDLKETPQERSPLAPEVPRSQRTAWNVRDADATLILLPASATAGPGTEWTKECSRLYQKPLLICDPYQTEAAAIISRWLKTQLVSILNVAGPSESTVPGIGAQTFRLLVQVLCP